MTYKTYKKFRKTDEKQIIIETLLQNIYNWSNNNIVASSNHKADKISFENLNSHEKSKMISNKSNQADDNSRNNIDNHKRISERKDEQYMAIEKKLKKAVHLL